MKMSNKAVRVATRLLTIVALVIILVTMGFWWWSEQKDPQNVFENAIKNQLRTKGVIKMVQQGSEQQGLNQAVSFNGTGEGQIFASTIISQSSQNTNAQVKTETIGTPSQEFFRYVQIDTDQTNAQGEQLDFSSVVGVWGDKSSQSQSSPGPELYDEFVFGAVPTEYMSAADADQLLNTMIEEGVYTPDYESAQLEYVSGCVGTFCDAFSFNKRPVMTFNVELNVAKYIELLKTFGDKIGQDRYANEQTEQYQNQPNLNFTLAVDVLTQRIKTIGFPNGAIETYGSYGAQRTHELPNNTVPFEQIVEDINKLQQ